MFRAATCLVPFAAVLVAASAHAQQPPPALPPAPPAQPADAPPVAPPQAHGEHDAREGHGDGMPGRGGRWRQHDGGRPDAMPHDANHTGPLAAALERHADEHVTTTVSSGSKNAILERRVLTQETTGHVAIALPLHTHTETWEQVCVAPCKVDLKRASFYRVAAGNGVPGTDSFTLTPNKEQIDLQVRPGNLARFATGGAITGLGIGAFITGAVLFTAAGKFEDEKDIRIAGAITGGAGLVLMAVGIPLLILNQTHVYADGTKVARCAPASGPRLGMGRIEF